MQRRGFTIEMQFQIKNQRKIIITYKYNLLGPPQFSRSFLLIPISLLAALKIFQKRGQKQRFHYTDSVGPSLRMHPVRLLSEVDLLAWCNCHMGTLSGYKLHSNQCA